MVGKSGKWYDVGVRVAQPRRVAASTEARSAAAGDPSVCAGPA